MEFDWEKTVKRRTFLQAIACGTTVLAAPQVLARIPDQLPVYDMPEEFLPREVRIKNDFAPYEIHVDPESAALHFMRRVSSTSAPRRNGQAGRQRPK